jgi:glycosyltransferase involved in cell wall biosynthesis
MNVPDISVVIAVKDEEPFIEGAIKSVLNQIGLACECVVVDDGSTDNTFAILSDIARGNANLRLFRNPKAGKCSAFNLGVSHATGRFVCLFAGDDLMAEGGLAKRLATVQDCPDNAPVVGLCKLITLSDVKRFNGHLVPRRPGKGGLTGASYLMNRPALEKIFPVPETLPNEDTWIELAVTHFHGWRIVHSDVVGYLWRVHSGNSINMFVPFDEYNKRITARMRAIALFHERHATELTASNRSRLSARVDCERKREDGDIVGILLSRVDLVEKLRALSIANAFFYGIRKQLFGLLSGW